MLIAKIRRKLPSIDDLDAEMWGKKWATAEFRMPWDAQSIAEDALDEAVSVMKTLIERSWKIVEKLKRD